MSDLKTAIELLKTVEWAGIRRGMGSGMMGSGGDGRANDACPICGGVAPKERRWGDFTAASYGHRDHCELGSFLAKAGKKEGDDG